MNILDAHTNAFVTAEAIVENLFHAHAARTIIAHLAYNLRGQGALQEETAITQVIARIAHAFCKYDTIAVHDRSAFSIQVLRMRHHRLRIDLINTTVQNLDVKSLPNEHTNRAKDKALQNKQRICAVLIHATPPLS